MKFFLTEDPSVDNLTAYLNSDEGKATLVKVEETLLNNQEKFKHVTLTYDSTTPITPGTSSNTYKVSFIVTPKSKFSFKDNNEKSVKIEVAFTAVKKTNCYLISLIVKRLG